VTSYGDYASVHALFVQEGSSQTWIPAALVPLDFRVHRHPNQATIVGRKRHLETHRSIRRIPGPFAGSRLSPSRHHPPIRRLTLQIIAETTSHAACWSATKAGKSCRESVETHVICLL